jgi:DNA-binding NtrC family response regulator
MSEFFDSWLNEMIRPRKILLVDDSEDDCEIITRFSTGFHIEWVLAHDAQSAISKFNNDGHFSMVILDLHLGMSPYDGVILFRKIKELTPDVPVLVLSGVLDNSLIAAIAKIGFAIFAVKPACFTEAFFTQLYGSINIPRKPRKP